MAELLRSNNENEYEGIAERPVIHSAFFVDDPEKLKQKYPPVHLNEFYHHTTIEYRPKNGKQGLEVGKKVQLEIIGRVTSDKVDALLIVNEKSEKENPHITLSTAEGIKSNASNSEIEKAIKKDAVEKLQDIIETTEGYFDGINDVKE